MSSAAPPSSFAARHSIAPTAWLLLLLMPAFAYALRYAMPGTSRLLESVELRLVNARFVLRGERSRETLKGVRQNVLIVAMDSDASGKLGNPLPRSAQAQLVRRLKSEGARAVIFDVIFADPRGPDDQVFARACREAGNVFLPMDDNASSPTPPALRRRIEAKFAYPVAGANPSRTVRLGPPVPALLDAIRGGGHVAIQNDIDGTYRSAILLLEEGAVYPHVALDAVCKTVWHVRPDQLSLRDGYLYVPGRSPIGPLERIPLPRTVGTGDAAHIEDTATGWTIPLNFLGGHRTMSTLTVPYLDVLEGRVPADQIRGRVVIVGEVREGSTDIRPGPFDTTERTFGVETNATQLANLMTSTPELGFLHHAPKSLSIATLVLFALGAGLSSLLLRPRVALLVISVVCLGYLLVTYEMFGNDNLILEITGPLFSATLSLFALSSYRLVVVERESAQNRIALQEAQELLGQSVNRNIAEKLLHDPIARQALQIGVRREITVLFSDIRGFTSWSERNAPEEVKARLDEYFPVMCEIAEDDCQGYIDKFVGDALMVVWNGMDDQEDHAKRAVRAAWSMLRALEGLNDGWSKQKLELFRIGIGIGSGPAVFGSFGARHKKMVTVLGDTVNLAARLESTTKEVGQNIVISHATYLAVQDEWECTPLGALPIRGKTEAQPIYGVIGPKRG